MSRFYGEIEGSAKTLATRRGRGEIFSHTRGWTSGIAVRGYVDADGKDRFEVVLTGGSNNPTGSTVLTVVDGKVVFAG